MIGSETTRNDLILVDPFDDFLMPDADGHIYAEHVLPMLSQIADHSTVLLFALNEDPCNPAGRRFDELLQNHLSGGFGMRCPPFQESKIKGESRCHADMVLAGSDLVNDPGEAADLRGRLELLARKLFDALGLPEHGQITMQPRLIRDAEQVAPY